MKDLARLQKLHELRNRRERLSLGRLASAKNAERRIEKELEEAKVSRIREIENGRTYIKSALKRAETMYGTTSKFTQISIALGKHRYNMELADKKIQLAQKKIVAAQRDQVEYRARFVSRTKDRLKIEHLLKKQTAIHNMQVSNIEEEDTQEICSTMRART